MNDTYVIRSSAGRWVLSRRLERHYDSVAGPAKAQAYSLQHPQERISLYRVEGPWPRWVATWQGGQRLFAPLETKVFAAASNS